MDSLLPILGCILFGMLLGLVLKNNASILLMADKASMLCIYFLLFVLGANLGSHKELMQKLPELGATALCLTVCCALGSILFLFIAERLFASAPQAGNTENDTENTAPRQSGSPLWGTLRILSYFIGGIILAWMDLLPVWLCSDKLPEYALWALVFTVGMGLGSELHAFSILRQLHVKIILIPALIVAGTLVGAMGASLILPHLTAQNSLSVGAGLGYYSLSSIIIGKTGNTALASISLLSNLFRELLSIIAAPLLSRYCGRLAPIGIAGAAAMDVCLPVIARFSGERYAILAVFSGMTLTLLVPFLVACIVYW